MKLLKAALILGLLTILASNAFAQADWGVTSALSLQDVASANLIYGCMDCIKENAEANLVWYACNRDSPNCEMTVSKKEGNNAQQIAKLKFGNSRIYFKKINNEYRLLTINLLRTNSKNIPLEINEISIPYVSGGDIIDFASANIETNTRETRTSNRQFLGPTYTTTSTSSIAPITREYFDKFYYKVGNYNQQEIPIKRNPFQTQSDLITLTGETVKRGEWRPISLCGKDFFDAVSETVNENLGEGQLRNVPRESWFLVSRDETSPDGCTLTSYRLSTKNDPNYVNNEARRNAQANVIGGYARDYKCGSVSYSISNSFAANLDCMPITEEPGVEQHASVLSCPYSQSGDAKKILCQKKSIPSMLVGSTRYLLRADSITASTENAIKEEPDIKKAINLFSTKEDILINDVVPTIAVKGENSWVIISSLLSQCDASRNGCYSLDITSSDSGDESSVQITGEGVVAVWDENRANLIRRYVFHLPTNYERQKVYEAIFKNNELIEITDTDVSSSGRDVDGITITGLRIEYPISARLTGSSQSNLQVREIDTINLYPLEEGQEEAVINRPYLTYTAGRNGERLYDIAARFYGAESIQQIQEQSGQIGVPSNSETAELRRNVEEFALTIQQFNKQRGNRAGWVQSNIHDPAIFSGEKVLIPQNALSYTSRRQRNTVTVHNVQDAPLRLFERQIESTQAVFHLTENINLPLGGEVASMPLPEERPITTPTGRIVSVTGAQTREQLLGRGCMVDPATGEITVCITGLRRSIPQPVPEVDCSTPGSVHGGDGCIMPTRRTRIRPTRNIQEPTREVTTEPVRNAEPESTRQIYTCSDSDGDYNAFVKGEVVLSLNGRPYIRFADRCFGDLLLERYCSNNQLRQSKRRCGISCDFGRCIKTRDEANNLAGTLQPIIDEAERDISARGRLWGVNCNGPTGADHAICQRIRRYSFCDSDGKCKPAESINDPLIEFDL